MTYAQIELGRPEPGDAENTILIRCTECASEWAWSRDTSRNYDRLSTLAQAHNFEMHGRVDIQ